jgi:hypothetical protein
MGSLAWPLTGPQAQQSVPASAQGGGDPIIQELVKNISTPFDPSVVKAATTPVPGAHSTGLPSNLTTPVQPHQNTPMIQGAVGRRAAKAQGISNAIIGVTNALGSVVTAEAQTKQNQIKDSATKVIMTQQAIDEATQAHDAALASGDAAAASKAQEQILKNKEVLNGVFADPKMRKALVKGFDISYTDPSSNKTEEHEAVQAAIKNAKTMKERQDLIKQQQASQQKASGQAAADAFLKQQPQGMTSNVQAQQQLAIEQSKQKATQQTLKDYLTFKASAMHANATVTAAQLREQGALMMKQSDYAHQEDMLQRRFSQAQQLLGTRYNNDLKLITARGAEARKVANEIFTDKEADPLSIYNKTRTAGETYQKNMLADISLYQQLQTQRDGMYKDSKGKQLTPDENSVKALDAQIKLVHDAIELDKSNAQNFTERASQLQKTFGLAEGSDNGSGSGTSSSSTNRSTDSTGTEETDADDPLAYLN